MFGRGWTGAKNSSFLHALLLNAKSKTDLIIRIIVPLTLFECGMSRKRDFCIILISDFTDRILIQAPAMK